MRDFELAEEAYKAYGKVTDFKNFQGNPIPEFVDLPLRIQSAWIAAARIVEDLVILNSPGYQRNRDA